MTALFIKKARTGIAVLLVALTAAVTLGAAPAHAESIVFCPEDAQGAHCDILPKTYANSGVNRSKIDGSFHALRAPTSDRLYGDVTVWDLSADGYRGRALVRVYWGCLCVSADKLYSSRSFDVTTGANTSKFHEIPLLSPPHSNSTQHYTVQVQVGRYDADTGVWQTDSALTQRFYITLP